MNSIMERMQKEGWYLSDQGFDLISNSGAITDIQKLIKRALDMDLKEIGSGQADINDGNVVLQIQKLRNVAAAKNNEESRSSPRMLKLYLTDGKNNYQALELEYISSLTLNTPPGTKLLLKPSTILMSHGIFLLKPSNISSVLGGKVPALIEKWELNKKLALHSRVRSAEEGGPPPWIPFGKKIIKITDGDKNLKSFSDKDGPLKDNTEFEAQRQDAIAEAAKQGSKKIFGGGTKQLLDHSVQRIVDQGFTVDQAEYALKVNRNNIDRALKSLQRNNENKISNNREPREAREPRGKRFDKKNEEAKPSSGKVSLYDFLEDKLPAQSDIPEIHTTQSADNFGHTRLDKNFERGEGRGMGNQYGKGGRGHRGGRGDYQAPPRHSDNTKFSKKSNNENFDTSQYGSSTNAYQGKPPRFQRNQQESHYQPEQTFRGNHGKSSQPTERKNDFSSGGYNKSHVKNYQNESSKSFQNHGESDVSIRQTDYGNNSRSQSRVSQNSNRGAFHQKSDNFKNQSSKYQGNSEVNNTKRNFGVQGQRTEHTDNHKSETSGGWAWKKGDQCMAKYWEDNRYYNAEVTAVSSRTCVVQFKEFRNYEEVLQVDCIPISEDFSQTFPNERTDDHRGGGNRAPRYEQNYSGVGMEFRRGGGGSGNGPGGNKGFHRKRGQQRSAQQIYQPPAQRGHARDNSQM